MGQLRGMCCLRRDGGHRRAGVLCQVVWKCQEEVGSSSRILWDDQADTAVARGQEGCVRLSWVPTSGCCPRGAEVLVESVGQVAPFL